jgi:hypothetical protein
MLAFGWQQATGQRSFRMQVIKSGDQALSVQIIPSVR